MCPACTHQITFKMLPEMDPKYSCDMPGHTQGWSSNVPSILLHCLPCTFNVPRTSSMFPKYTHWTYPRNIFDNICGSWFECYWWLHAGYMLRSQSGCTQNVIGGYIGRKMIRSPQFTQDVPTGFQVTSPPVRCHHWTEWRLASSPSSPLQSYAPKYRAIG